MRGRTRMNMFCWGRHSRHWDWQRCGYYWGSTAKYGRWLGICGAGRTSRAGREEMKARAILRVASRREGPAPRKSFLLDTGRETSPAITSLRNCGQELTSRHTLQHTCCQIIKNRNRVTHLEGDTCRIAPQRWNPSRQLLPGQNKCFSGRFVLRCGRGWR